MTLVSDVKTKLSSINLADLKPKLDNVRKMADSVRAQVDAVAGFAKLIPVIGPNVAAAVILLDGLDDTLDALDNALSGK